MGNDPDLDAAVFGFTVTTEQRCSYTARLLVSKFQDRNSLYARAGEDAPAEWPHLSGDMGIRGLHASHREFGCPLHGS